MAHAERDQARALLARQAEWGRLTPDEQELAVAALLNDWTEFGKIRGLRLSAYADTEWWLTFLADVLSVSIPGLDTWRIT